MRFIAHTGLPKTGTSAVQEWLHARAADLLAHGIVVPVEILPAHGNCILVIEALMIPKAQRNPKQADLVEKTREIIARPGATDFLISSEYLEKVIYWPERTRTFQAGLAEVGAKWDMALTVLRNPLDILNSTYAQNIKNEYYPRSFPGFLTFRRDNKINEYSRNILLLRQAGVDVRVMAYRGSKTTMPLTEQLIQLAGLRDRLPENFDFTAPYSNESFGGLGVIAARHIWSVAHHAAPGMASNLQYQFGVILREELSKLNDRPFNGFSAEMRRFYTRHFAASLAALKPDLDAEDFELLQISRSACDPVSASGWEDLDATDRQQIHESLARIAERVGGHPLLADFLPQRFFLRLPRIGEQRPAGISQKLAQ